MKKGKNIGFLIVGIGIGLGIYHFFLLPKDDLQFNGQSASWIKDKKKAKVTVGPNYLFAARTDVGLEEIKGAVPSSNVIDGVKFLKTYTDTCKSFKKPRTFIVDLSRDEIFKYFGNIERLTNTESLRIYLGMYLPTHPLHPNRMTAYVVAKGTDKKEKYVDGTTGFEIINLGSLCPTDCPDENLDPMAIHIRAGKPQ